MYLIVGLGNPEPEYSNTRHNLGFDVLNKIAKQYEIELNKNKLDAIYGSGIIEGKKVILIKPQTYMNLSGEAVQKYVDFYKIELENVLVIYDDLDTEISRIRIRSKGSAGSHNGMKSVINSLGSKEFPRIRIGIGRPKDEFDRRNYVIGKIQDDDECEKLKEAVDKAAKAAVYFLNNGIDNTMNKFNI